MSDEPSNTNPNERSGDDSSSSSDLPPVHNQGLPLWVFKLIRILLCLCPCDAYFVFPLIFLIVIGVLGGISGLLQRDTAQTATFAIMGILAAACMALWLRWAKLNPPVPDEDDVLRIALTTARDDVNTLLLPTAPIPPTRNELVAKNSCWFHDNVGRRVLLRGINCQAGSKLPLYPSDQSSTHLPNTQFFWNHENDEEEVSFIGRPFPLDEADFHLSRLRLMGMTCLRLLVTWEAIEHAGPKQYDLAYLEYVRQLIEKCDAHGLVVFVDFHQDVWCRWTGGDGAPAWTLDAVGLDLTQLDASGAALTHQYYCNNKNTNTTKKKNDDDNNNNDSQKKKDDDTDSTDDEYPKMVWNSNNFRLAAGTMWTCFFAGNDFAPNTYVNVQNNSSSINNDEDEEKQQQQQDVRVPIQEYLQSHFVDAMSQVAQTLKDCPNVLGFDILNEPSCGFVGVHDVRDIGPNSYYVGWRVDAWSAMKMGAGETCTVDYFSSFMYLDGKRTLNTTGACAWKNGPTSCVWCQNGVWQMNASTYKPQLLKPFYFASNPRTGKEIDFLKDYGLPFWFKAARAIRQHMPDAIIFAEPILDMTDPSKVDSPILTDDQVGAGYVWADHYYDGMTLMTKSYSKYRGLDSVTQKPSLGMRAIERSYSKGIEVSIREASQISNGGCPVLIGECGIPFDLGAMDKKPVFFGCAPQKTAFDTNNFSTCTNALNRTMSALEKAKVSYTIWCYQPDNTNQFGDGWNGEDLSLFSKDQVVPGDEDNIFAGGRSLLAAIRPYPHRVAGDVVSFSFALYRKDRRFVLEFTADHSLETNETVIFLPKYQYPHGVLVSIKKGGGSYRVDWETQTLTYSHLRSSSTNRIVVTKVRMAKGGCKRSSESAVELPSTTVD